MTTQPQYAIHSVVRSVKFRMHRAQLPAHLRKKHYIGTEQARLLPGRTLVVTEELLLKNLAELREKAAHHILEVRTMDGRVIDLETLVVGPAAPAVVQPHPRLDSVAYDKQVGMYIPPYVGDDTAMPQILAPGEKPALFKDAATDFTAPSSEPTTAPVATSEEELEAAVAAAQAEAEEAQTEEEEAPSAPTGKEQVSSQEAPTNPGSRKKARR